jgi:hypothetical protein
LRSYGRLADLVSDGKDVDARRIGVGTWTPPAQPCSPATRRPRFATSCTDA